MVGTDEAAEPNPLDQLEEGASGLQLSWFCYCSEKQKVSNSFKGVESLPSSEVGEEMMHWKPPMPVGVLQEEWKTSKHRLKSCSYVMSLPREQLNGPPCTCKQLIHENLAIFRAERAAEEKHEIHTVIIFKTREKEQGKQVADGMYSA